MDARSTPPKLRRNEVHVSRCAGDVRASLAAYLGVDPGSVELERGAYGKPALAGEGGIRFSVARSGGLTLLAVTRGREVGVDVERIEPERAHGPIADRLFAPDEAAELRRLPFDERTRRFFQLWTRKEAYAKALGVGMAVPLRRLQAPSGWTVEDVSVGEGYAAAVCVQGRGTRLRLLG
jgi:4'-phosphopantetheinyl transferase